MRKLSLWFRSCCWRWCHRVAGCRQFARRRQSIRNRPGLIRRRSPTPASPIRTPTPSSCKSPSASSCLNIGDRPGHLARRDLAHIGEAAYYQTVQNYLDARTVVLYEGINADAHKRRLTQPGVVQTNLGAD